MNECHGYDIFSNADPVRGMWRVYFATDVFSFNQFSRDFPNNKRKSAISRQVGNPENYFFAHKNVAVFGLNRVDGRSYLKNKVPIDLNEVWVNDRLLLKKESCELKTVVIVRRRRPSTEIWRSSPPRVVAKRSPCWRCQGMASLPGRTA